MHRRSFCLRAIYGLWTLMSSVVGAAAAIYLCNFPRSRKKDEWVDAAADISDLKLKSPKEVVFRRNRADGWKITSEKATAWIVKLSDKELVAISPQCTHLGCICHWEEEKQRFVCPCHSSTFSIDGQVLSGPAARPLDRYEIKVQANRLRVGLLRKPDGPAQQAARL